MSPENEKVLVFEKKKKEEGTCEKTGEGGGALREDCCLTVRELRSEVFLSQTLACHQWTCVIVLCGPSWRLRPMNVSSHLWRFPNCGAHRMAFLGPAKCSSHDACQVNRNE